MPQDPVEIRDIIIQGLKGQFKKAQSEGNLAWQPEVVGNYICQRPIIKDTGVEDPLRVDKVVGLIRSIANTLEKQHQPDKEPRQITRAITDEFSFYPEDRPFTVEEYKEIIKRTAEIANQLPPDIHMVIATLPVLWPDWGIHNCGLYVESPHEVGRNATLHHFSKVNNSAIDFTYKPPIGDAYQLTSDQGCTAMELPNVLLRGTAVSTNDINQFESALKMSTSDGREFITTIGICLDHSQGVERRQAHGLINQLQANGQHVPLHCSHVITSASIDEKSSNILSTVSHADELTEVRQVPKYPTRKNFQPLKLSSDFSGELTAEAYRPRLIGTLHSDLFQHAVANQTTTGLNEPDNAGNTLLHRVFRETDFDREMISKRLYSMIINGGDPTIENMGGFSVIDLAKGADSKANIPGDAMVFNAVSSALAWREHVAEQNTPSSNDGHTHLTRELTKSPIDYDKIRELVLNGANPYQKNNHSQSAIDITHQLPPDVGQYTENLVMSAFIGTQYGLHTTTLTNKRKEDNWFMPPQLSSAEIREAFELKNSLDFFLLHNGETYFLTALSLLTSKQVDSVDRLDSSNPRRLPDTMLQIAIRMHLPKSFQALLERYSPEGLNGLLKATDLGVLAEAVYNNLGMESYFALIDKLPFERASKLVLPYSISPESMKTLVYHITQMKNEDAKQNFIHKALYQVVNNKDEDSLRSLLKHNPDLNIPNASGYTAVFFAVSQGQFGMLSMLVEHGANVDIPAYPSPLLAAILTEQTDSVRLLLQHSKTVSLPIGCNVDNLRRLVHYYNPAKLGNLDQYILAHSLTTSSTIAMTPKDIANILNHQGIVEVFKASHGKEPNDGTISSQKEFKRELAEVKAEKPKEESAEKDENTGLSIDNH